MSKNMGKYDFSRGCTIRFGMGFYVNKIADFGGQKL